MQDEERCEHTRNALVKMYLFVSNHLSLKRNVCVFRIHLLMIVFRRSLKIMLL